MTSDGSRTICDQLKKSAEASFKNSPLKNSPEARMKISAEKIKIYSAVCYKLLDREAKIASKLTKDMERQYKLAKTFELLLDQHISTNSLIDIENIEKTLEIMKKDSQCS